MRVSPGTAWFGICLLSACTSAPVAPADALDKRIADAEAVFVGRIASVEPVEQEAACADSRTKSYRAFVRIETLVVGSTQQLPLLNVEVVLLAGNGSLMQVRERLQGKTFAFYGDIKNNPDSQLVRIMFPPCGAEPEETSALPTIMRTVADCYGISGPNETRPPTRKCRRS